MDRSEEFEFKLPKLPKELDEQYEVLSVLSWKKKSRVFLTISRENRKKHIIKYGKGKRAVLLKNEYVILSKRDYPFLPTCYFIVEKEKCVWLVREYIEGKSLSKIIEDSDPIGLKDAIKYLEKVCDCIGVFHAENPPLLHRDIKPDNILVKPDGSIIFIDLDTVREYDKNKNRDTIYVGTQLTAAPEQFGYKQTSVRTDIYSLGILFLFLLTGEYSVYSRGWNTLPAEVKRVISRCVNFDPQDRYQSVSVLKNELSSLKRFGVRRRVAGWVAAVFICLIGMTGAGVFHGIQEYRYVHESVSFSEPIIEKAVREALVKNEKEIITKEELSHVSTIIICQDQVFFDMEEHQRYHDDNWFEFEESDERSVAIDTADLKSLTGLRNLVLDNCGLIDISGLDGLNLEVLSIRKNDIEDISVLKRMDNLKELVIDRNPISDISALSSCKKLQSLRIQNTLITDISSLKGLPIVYLDMVDSPIEDKSVVASFTKLRSLFADNMSDSDVENLREIKGLERLGIYRSKIEDLDGFEEHDRLVNIDLSYCDNIKDAHWLKSHIGLDYLGLAHTGITDISDISVCKMLTHLDISGTPVKDLSVLKSLSGLEVVYIDSSKEGAAAMAELSDTMEVIVTE